VKLLVSAVMAHFSRALSRRSYLAYVSEPTAEPPRVTYYYVRQNEDAVGKPESVSAEPAGPVPVPAIPVAAPTSEGGPGIEGPVGFPFTGVPLEYPGGRAGPISIESPPMPRSEWGMRPPPGLATVENELYQTASSDSDVSGPSTSTIQSPPTRPPQV